MAEREPARIVHDIMSEPHVRGRRVSVRQIAELVEGEGEKPATVEDRFDLDVADVYHALAYYHDHPREMERIELERAEVFESFEESIERPEAVDPEGA
jgi:uncharacterized protein (DUF433 family)